MFAVLYEEYVSCCRMRVLLEYLERNHVLSFLELVLENLAMIFHALDVLHAVCGCASRSRGVDVLIGENIGGHVEIGFGI